MKRLQMDAGKIQVLLNAEELLAISNSLNEVCHGIDIPEFETRLGVSREVAEKFLLQLTSLLDEMSAT